MQEMVCATHHRYENTISDLSISMHTTLLPLSLPLYFQPDQSGAREPRPDPVSFGSNAARVWPTDILEMVMLLPYRLSVYRLSLSTSRLPIDEPIDESLAYLAVV